MLVVELVEHLIQVHILVVLVEVVHQQLQQFQPLMQRHTLVEAVVVELTQKLEHP
jgi:hypothetical protein